MEVINNLVAFKRLQAGLTVLAGECLKDLEKADTPKEMERALFSVRGRVGAVQRSLDKLLPETKSGEDS